MFQTDLLSTIRSFNTVYTAIGICYASYVDCLRARSGPDLARRTATEQCVPPLVLVTNLFFGTASSISSKQTSCQKAIHHCYYKTSLIRSSPSLTALTTWNSIPVSPFLAKFLYCKQSLSCNHFLLQISAVFVSLMSVIKTCQNTAIIN
jgi:hypothetical protein